MVEPALPDDVLGIVEHAIPDLTKDKLELVPLAGDGSRRRFFRLTQGPRPLVLMYNPIARTGAPTENDCHLYIHSVLHTKQVRVPEIFFADPATGLVLMEDLGDRHLFDLLSDDVSQLEEFYWKALEQLVRVQAPNVPPFDAKRCPHPAYDADFILAEEAGYFYRELVEGVASMSAPVEALAKDCLRLAERALSGNPVLIHRDFQSRNLMVVDGQAGGELVVIDFQGARLGPAQYDLAALLYDPYASLPRALRLRLLGYYIYVAGRAKLPGIPAVSADADGTRRPPPGSEARKAAESVVLSPSCRPWYDVLLANAANRLMQALGAFAKLGVREGRPGFKEHIPAGLDLLEETLEEIGDCPALYRLVADLCLRNWD